jgi:hypothetical protein
MASIKVTYNSISRRFNITSPNWVELESKLRTLYNIPTTSSLIVSYKDEDGDVITLSSDLELKEILAQQSSGRPIKLILSTVNNSENLVSEDENDNDVVNNESSNVEDNNNHIDDFSSLQQNQQQTTEFESRPPSYYQHVTLEDEEEPEDGQSTPLLNKEKEKESEKQRPESTNENKAQPENENKENEDDEDEDDDEIVFIISCPWARQTFFGPRFGPRFGPGFGPGFGPRFGPGFGPRLGPGFGPRFGFFGGPRFGLFDGLFDGLFSGPHHHSFSPFNFYGRPQCHRSAFSNGYGGPSAYYFNSRQCGPDACNGNSKPSCCSNQQQSDFYNKNAEACTSASAKSNKCNKNKYYHSSRFSCGRNTFTQEQLNEKLSTLYSMGFDSSNNALYEDLLKRYNGNLERVIELLLRSQQVNEYYDNDKSSTSESKKPNGIVINEEKQNNAEIKHVDNEESKPYNL